MAQAKISTNAKLSICGSFSYQRLRFCRLAAGRLEAISRIYELSLRTVMNAA